MGIFERLSDVLKSYLADDTGAHSDFHARGSAFTDPDLADAYSELNDFLQGSSDAPFSSYSKPRGAHSAHAKPSEAHATYTKSARLPPESLRPDFAELQVPFGAQADECKAAYKNLLKKHHPDRHAGHEGNVKKATAKSARINTAYERICAWREKDKP